MALQYQIYTKIDLSLQKLPLQTQLSNIPEAIKQGRLAPCKSSTMYTLSKEKRLVELNILRSNKYVVNILIIKREVRCTKAPAYAGSGKGPTNWYIVRSLILFFTQEAVSKTLTSNIIKKNFYFCIN